MEITTPHISRLWKELASSHLFSVLCSSAIFWACKSTVTVKTRCVCLFNMLPLLYGPFTFFTSSSPIEKCSTRVAGNTSISCSKRSHFLPLWGCLSCWAMLLTNWCPSSCRSKTLLTLCVSILLTSRWKMWRVVSNQIPSMASSLPTWWLWFHFCWGWFSASTKLVRPAVNSSVTYKCGISASIWPLLSHPRLASSPLCSHNFFQFSS